MTSVRVSIIIPVYNAKHTLAKAIESVVCQSYKERELIIVDGASTDGSLEILQTNQSHFSHFISAPDRGVYDAINKGLDVASGEWIFVLGADDYLADEFILEKIFNRNISDAQLIFGSAKNVDSAHQLVRSLHVSSFNSSIYWRNTLHQQSVFYHRSLFEDFRFNIDYKILADYDFHLLLFTRNVRYQKTDLVIAHCMASGLSKNFGWSLYAEELKLKKVRLNGWIYLLNLPVVVTKFLAKQLFQINRH